MHISSKIVNYSNRHLGTIKCRKCGKKCVKTGTRQFLCPQCKPKHNRAITDKWNKVLKRQKKIEKKNEQPPQFYCQNIKCNALIQLDFKPLEDKQRWREFKCPFCQTKAIWNNKKNRSLRTVFMFETFSKPVDILWVEIWALYIYLLGNLMKSLTRKIKANCQST